VIEKGSVQPTGAVGSITLFYLRDPDDNLIEIASYLQATLEEYLRQIEEKGGALTFCSSESNATAVFFYD